MTESHPRLHRYPFRWVPHFPAYNEAIKDPKEREAANQIARERGMLQLYEEEYRHLPPLPPQLPHPLYEMQDPPGYRKDDASRAFYKSCAEGNLDLVRMFVAALAPTGADLSFALEEACQNFQPEVVRFLMRQPEAQLHYRCFRRCIENHHDDLAGNIKFYSHTPAYLSSDSVSESIFTSGSRELLPLLRVLVDSGWHPNQLLGPTQKGKRRPFNLPCQEVALHYPRCILDTEILRFLLDAGADPTIGREVNRDFAFGIINLPVQRLKGHILEMAVNLGAAEAVDLLVSHGARPEHGVTLHSLIRRRPDPAAVKVMDEEYREELCRETPWLEYPTLSNRFAIAQQLLDLGEDINRVDNVFRLMGRYVRMPCLSQETTPLLHARDSMDWEFVRWLLEHGADPAIRPRDAGLDSQRRYSIGTEHWELEATFEGMIRQFYRPLKNELPVKNEQAVKNERLH
ncbi:hypothetical protein CPLU01_08478 [Colletotrichum plurivorum]|uniref:Ankyrin repeat protein n=1 Tax=Colletotrichum plurivorum TaxID=2175906 RepID=A0A8H6NDF1_9PEZI|nr:hypothetical protein CPLU01_08478 [Colletotrichum plurivorum]